CLHRGQGLCVQLYAWLQRVQVLRYLGSLSGGGSALAARICFRTATIWSLMLFCMVCTAGFTSKVLLGLRPVLAFCTCMRGSVGFGGESILEGARFYGNYG